MNYVFKRPFCIAFIDFCFENFHVGVWSSRMEANVRKILDYIGEGLQHKVMFVMHQGDCTATGFKNPTNRRQPLFLKELAKVWSRFPDGEFNETNTLLIDDTPYKALLNPPHTAIFLKPYTYNEQDNFLAEGLVGYLTHLRNAADVREFVRMHPIGMPAIAAGCMHWNLYRSVLEKIKEVTDASTHRIASGNLEPRPHFSSTAEALVLEESVRNLSLH
uniref:Mitochondrial import inner membrane translocase subunit TIM50 n=1 Tax=Physcomitrium patens TaxID=3218 RepID=A9RTE8_PHYPA|nr:ubiquitin-like domain-containing CTD phosphatase 1 [Physcomitrium patens]PNR31643.1 hypothetical protein PHYPA_025764 [Physcomitrium patens]|eukprot:XP_024358689.1 ubiquitin-like domain-containing CTD phosphatase 1 [Physcomitrella patens]